MSEGHLALSDAPTMAIERARNTVSGERNPCLSTGTAFLSLLHFCMFCRSRSGASTKRRTEDFHPLVHLTFAFLRGEEKSGKHFSIGHKGRILGRYLRWTGR